MEAKDYLQDYALRAERHLDEFFSQKKKETSKVSPEIARLMDVYRDYMRGGKMARGALTVLGYQVSGGRDFEAILPASIAIEIIHSFLLIHDDWIDQDERRRGKPTVHQQFSQEQGDHFGASLAIILGDAGAFLSYELMASSSFPEKRKIKALCLLNQFLLKTAYGEILDIKYDFLKEITWDEIMLVRKYKTAIYTIVMPLSIGAVLAGARESKLKAIEKYGLPVGIAFQLQDDILGVFGETEKTGKSAESDIRGGKMTLLYAKALELASPKEKKFLLKHYGRRKITAEQIGQIRRIIEDTGALAFSQKEAKRLVEQGKKFIPQITVNQEIQSTLNSLADFMIERKK
jgi:geranylgeranyl diphosphate synthase type I